jgi:hypothetical protein
VPLPNDRWHVRHQLKTCRNAVLWFLVLAALRHAVLRLCPSVSEFFLVLYIARVVAIQSLSNSEASRTLFGHFRTLAESGYACSTTLCVGVACVPHTHALPLSTHPCWLFAGVHMDMQRPRVDKQGWLSLLVNHSCISSVKNHSPNGDGLCVLRVRSQGCCWTPGTRDAVPASTICTAVASVC